MRRLALPSLASAGILLALALPAAPALTGCDSSDPISCAAGGELEVVDTTPEGTRLGARITPNDCVYLTYEGRLDATGEVFDQNERVALLLTPQRAGDTGTVPGFRQAVVGRRVGESVRATIPPTLAYGAQPPAQSDIPACATLQFDITIGDTAPPSVCRGQ